MDDDWYLGTAHAVYKDIYSIEEADSEYLLVLAADHVYKMDYRHMLAFHRAHGGSATVGTLRVPVAAAAGQLGVVATDPGNRVSAFLEKPEHPPPLPGDAGRCLASMGIYVFTTRFLIDELRRNADAPDPGHDFGHHLLPRIIDRERVYACDYTGLGTGAGAYWRDVGTLDAYYQANMALLADAPGLDLYEKTWPLYSFHPSFPPARVWVGPTPGEHSSGCRGRNIYANGTVSEGSVRGSVVGFDCRLGPGAAVGDSILFDRVSVGNGAAVSRAILDKGVRVLPGAKVGFDPEADRRRGFVRSPGGVTCVPKGLLVHPG